MSDILRIRLLRGVMLAGQPHAAGCVLDAPQSLATDLVRDQKAELAPGAKLYEISRDEDMRRKAKQRSDRRAAQDARAKARHG